jgi:hypothetical protein
VLSYFFALGLMAAELIATAAPKKGVNPATRHPGLQP